MASPAIFYLFLPFAPPISSSLTAPKLLNCKQIPLQEWLNNPACIYIGRYNPDAKMRSVWGNPFRIGKDTREEVIQKYILFLSNDFQLYERLQELKNKNLICHCAPLPCHGIILLRLANSTDAEVF